MPLIKSWRREEWSLERRLEQKSVAWGSRDIGSISLFLADGKAMEPDGDKAILVGCPSETVSSVSLETIDRG